MNKNKENKYPTLKVMIVYTPLANFLGGFPMMYLFLGFGQGIILAIFTGFLVSFLPALLMGCIMVYFKIKIKNPLDYLKIFLMAFGVVFLFYYAVIIGVGWFYFKVIDFRAYQDFLILIFGFFNAMISVILAKFILPKS